MKSNAQLTNQPTNQKTNQRTNQPIDQPANRPTNQQTNEPTDQPTNRVFVIYLILLSWKTYKYDYEAEELSNPRPTQPKNKIG